MSFLCLFGKGTKISKYLIEHDKVYRAKIKLGIRTSTGDREGEIIEEKEIKPLSIEKANIEKVLESFLGKQIQKPPIYSAIKVKGKKLYEYAREGKQVNIPERKIEIYELKLLDIDKEDFEISIEVSCSKGTYIRTLCEDIAKKLGEAGTMWNLNRIRVRKF